jgi:hypothetical protein
MCVIRQQSHVGAGLAAYGSSQEMLVLVWLPQAAKPAPTQIICELPQAVRIQEEMRPE